ncbi:hypothetical protein ONZ43_g5761 [Nemania bipapillata]|uniref:Uncharacterized protein n=1 Tax=Nemania bipapillata TaxID=110536 RepID=A0ACC2I6R5_9PEZI|nr:hypothetical protein ONZ43_g5761 [Nemania bipapillata]
MPQLRVATPIDVPRIVNIVIAAMPHNAHWNYRFPYRREFPEDHFNYTKELYELFTDPEHGDWLVHVIELSPQEQAELDNRRHENDSQFDMSTYNAAPLITAIAVWDVSYKNKRTHGPSYQPFSPPAYLSEHGGSSRRDANPVHQREFAQNGVRAKELLASYGDDQLRLQILATHPDHWRRGYATMLCEWGLQTASEEGLVLSLSASEVGKGLYEHLGFKNLGTVTGQVPGEEASFTSTVFVLEPGQEKPAVRENL